MIALKRTIPLVIQLTLALFVPAFAESASGKEAEFLEPPDYSPTFRLTAIRISGADNTMNRKIRIDFERIRPGDLRVNLGMLDQDGSMSPLSSVGDVIHRKKDKGTIELQQVLPGAGATKLSDVEFFLYTYETLAEERAVRYLVSNSLRENGRRQSLKARAWTAEEKLLLAKHHLGKKPPSELPPQHVAVGPSTVLPAGIRVSVARFGEWVPAELLVARSEPAFTVKLLPGNQIKRVFGYEWLAVDSNLLRQATENPTAFSPSVRVLPAGLLPIPSNAQPVPPNLRLARNTELLMEGAGLKWEKVLVVEDLGSSIKVGFAGYSHDSDRDIPRTQLLIESTTLQRMQSASDRARLDAEWKEDFQRAEMEEVSKTMNRQNGSATAPRRVQSYPVNASLPTNAVFVPVDEFIPKGTPLAACWGSRWYPVVALQDSKQGPIEIQWKDFSSSWDCAVQRNELVIEKTILDSLHGPSLEKSASARHESRIWSDSTGKFKVTATLVRKSGSDVFLKNGDGKEIKIALERLSAADQTFLSTLEVPDKSPSVNVK